MTIAQRRSRASRTESDWRVSWERRSASPIQQSVWKQRWWRRIDRTWKAKLVTTWTAPAPPPVPWVFVWGRGLKLQRRWGSRRWESLMMGFRGLDFLWGLDLLFGFSVGWWWLMIVGWWWWLGVGDFGFVLGLWEGSREEEGEGNNKKCKMNEYFIE